MKQHLLDLVSDFGAIEWMLVWLALVVPSALTIGVAWNAMSVRRTKVAIGAFAAFAVLSVALLWFLSKHGAWMIRKTLAAGGEFLVVGGLCLLALPLILLGRELRTWFGLLRSGMRGERRRRAAMRSASGLSAILATGVGLAAGGYATYAWFFVAIAVALIGLGWFGFVLMPEGLGED